MWIPYSSAYWIKADTLAYPCTSIIHLYICLCLRGTHYLLCFRHFNYINSVNVDQT